MRNMFRSLGIFNYRLWFIGALVSNVGTWMQRTAQDWIVLTELTDYDAAALGVTMALQLGPQLLLLPVTGLVADRFDRRKILFFTQAMMGALGLGLGLMVISDVAELWHVNAFALGLGVVAAFDAPVRQAFVSQIVAEKDLVNAVGLNSLSFHSARLIGPALAGLLIALVGTGWVFLINALTFAAVLIALGAMRRGDLLASPKVKRAKGQIRDGFRYVRRRPDIMVTLVMVSLVGTFGFNFAIFISTMVTVEFNRGPGDYGLLSSFMAIGAVTGSLLAARRKLPRMRVVALAAAGFGLASITAALMPTYWTFAAALILVGVTSLTMMTSANAYVQTTTEPAMRGRVMALYMAIFMGGTPLGAPLVGWVANLWGPRWALGVAALSGLIAAAVTLWWMVRYRDLRVRYYRDSRPRLRAHYRGDGRKATIEETMTVDAATSEIAVVEGNTQRS
jgi:MFS family permease